MGCDVGVSVIRGSLNFHFSWTGDERLLETISSTLDVNSKMKINEFLGKKCENARSSSANGFRGQLFLTTGL